MSVERRKYIRLSTIFPVEFYLEDKDGKRLTPWLQGFTHDIARGGICLFINDLWWGFWDKIKSKNYTIFVRIDVPFKKEPIVAKAQVSWTYDKRGKEFKQYRVGIEFTDLPLLQAQKLFNYAIFHKFLPFVISAFVLLIFLYGSILFYHNQILINHQRSLVNEYASISDKGMFLEKALDREKNTANLFKIRKEALEKDINRLNKEVNILGARSRSIKDNQKISETLRQSKVDIIDNKVVSLEQELIALKKENEFLKARQQERQENTLKIEQEVKDLESKRVQVSKKIIEGMYEWIKNRQDLVKGLVLSYEGDSKLNKVCFTYDQALAVIVFLLHDDIKAAERILDFYLNKINKEGKIYNAYYTSGDEFEATYHSGPNAWIAIAALNYIKKTSNEKYLPLVKKIHGILLPLIDKEGGIAGGPVEKWYSTEHNLDTYSFYELFYEVTKNQEYKQIAEKIKNWLFKYSYTQYGGIVKRGKGDATIATDTYAWSITAIDPGILFAGRMNPEKIIEFALQSCEVEAKFIRSDNTVIIKGFDFAKTRNRPGGYVISGEWTAQMILAFEVIADYYQNKDINKSEQYMNKAVEYFNQLQKMVITSSSKFGREDPCLPYASRADVDTGHGWRTPKGDKTGSLSATAYFLISYYGYNPLQSKLLKVSLKNRYNEEINK